MGQQQPDIFSDPHAGTPLRGDVRRVMEAQAEDDPRLTDPHAGEPLRVNASKTRGWFDVDFVTPPKREDFPVYNMLKGAANILKEIPAGTVAFARDLPPGLDADGSVHYPLEDTLKGVGAAHVETGRKALEDFQAGDYVTAARRAINALIPALGPALDASTDKMMEGNVGEGIGEIATNTSLTLAGFRPRSAGAPRTARAAGRMTPEEAAAVEFAKQEGIPLDAGTATGSQFVKNLQANVGSTIGGANTVENAQAAQAQALRAASERLTARANEGGPAVTAVEAGEGVRSALQGRIKRLYGEQNAAYSKVREAESRAPEELVQARPAKAMPIAPNVPPDHAFLARWLADDLREMSFEPGSRMGRSARLAEYEQATSMEGFRESVYTPRIPGTPVQAMMHAIGIKGTRKEIAAKLDRYMQTGQTRGKIPVLLEAMQEAWNGVQFDFNQISDATIAKLGVRRRDLRSPLTTPFPDDMPGVYNRWFGQSDELWEARQAAKGERWEADPDDFTFGDDTPTPELKRVLPDEAVPEPPSATGGATGGTEAMRLATDVRGLKDELRPLLQELQRERELTGRLSGDKAQVVMAFDALVNGPDYAPALTVEAARGAFLKMARGADMPELRTQGQGAASRIAAKLDKAVRERVQAAGPGVSVALAAGRQATRSKYLTADVMKRIAPNSREPRAIFDALTRNKDAGIAKLRDVQKHVPDELPNVARALLEDIFELPTARGGFSNADGAWARWQKIGPESKAILFPSRAHRVALDNFFLLAKKIGEQPNPSGTARTINATNIIAAIPAFPLAKLLYSPTGVRALTGVAELPINPRTSAARAAAIAQLERVAKEQGVVLEWPAAAEGTREQQ